MSRKLTPGQAAKWGIHEKETYAINCALKKHACWIGRQPVMVINDHSSLEKWTSQVFPTPRRPISRQARWHKLLGQFDMHVQYVPGKQNEIPDALSRYASPAGLIDVSVHGSPEDDTAMRDLIHQEGEQERQRRCIWMRRDVPPFFGGLRGANHQESPVAESAINRVASSGVATALFIHCTFPARSGMSTAGRIFYRGYWVSCHGAAYRPYHESGLDTALRSMPRVS